MIKEALEMTKREGSLAKVRTGGTTAEGFPEPLALARFLEQGRAAGVPFKATAGLHHAMRGYYPLTYETDSPAATMHGFINLLLAAAFVLGEDWNSNQAAEVLNEQDPAEFQWEPESVAWGEHRLTLSALKRCRAEFMRSFGSCSFKSQSRILNLWTGCKGELAH